MPPRARNRTIVNRSPSLSPRRSWCLPPSGAGRDSVGSCSFMIDPKCIWLIMHETSAYRDANIGINCLHPGGASCLALIHLLVTGFTWRFNPAAGCRRRAFRLPVRNRLDYQRLAQSRSICSGFGGVIAFGMRRDPPRKALGGEQRRHENENVKDYHPERRRRCTARSQRTLRTDHGDRDRKSV